MMATAATLFGFALSLPSRPPCAGGRWERRMLRGLRAVPLTQVGVHSVCARGLLLKIYIFPTTLHPQVGSRFSRRCFPASWIYFLARLPTTTLGPVGWGSAAAAAEHACSPQTRGARRGATSRARAGKAKLTPQQLDAKLWSDAAAPQCACAVRLFDPPASSRVLEGSA